MAKATASADQFPFIVQSMVKALHDIPWDLSELYSFSSRVTRLVLFRTTNLGTQDTISCNTEEHAICSIRQLSRIEPKSMFHGSYVESSLVDELR